MNLSPRQRAFFLLTLNRHGKAAATLFKFTPPSEAKLYAQMLDDLKGHSDRGVETVAKSELSRLNTANARSYLSQVHVDWLAEALKPEIPAVIAAVLRCLPAEQSHAVLERLGPEVVVAMPKLSDTFAVPQTLVDHMRHHFENQFVNERTYVSGEPLEYSHLCVMPGRLIEGVFLNLGFHEIALALTGLPQRARDLVLSRLLPDDAKAVLAAITEVKTIAPGRIKIAQANLMDAKTNGAEPRGFVLSLGFSVFARSVLPKDLTDVAVVKKKMSKIYAGTLQDAIDHVLSEGTEATTLVYREEVLKAMKKTVGDY